MELVLFISLVALSIVLTSIFLYVRVKHGYLAGLFTKIIASFGFVALAVFMYFTKIQISYYSGIAICLIILGLVCGLIGDVLLDLKIIYPFHDDKYLTAGMIAFGVGHFFYIAAMLTLVSGEMEIFYYNWLPLLLIVLGAVVACLLVWLVSVKLLKLKFGKHTLITNCYSFVLLLTTALAVFLCFVGVSFKMYILAAGFVLFLISDLILSTQYFGGKQESKPLIVFNHLFYYLAQITIASFIYFI